MNWIIRNHTQGKYVAPGGQRSAYTTDRFKARRFPSEEAAERDCCGDESPVKLQ